MQPSSDHDIQTVHTLSSRCQHTASNCSNHMAQIIALTNSKVNRCAIVDQFSPCHITDVMCIDDAIAPSSSIGQVSAIFQAFEEFSLEIGPKFNIGPSESAIMGPMGSLASSLADGKPTYFCTVVPPVDTYPYLV